MSESSLVDYMVVGLKGHWRWAVKHVDPYTPGVPDISAWIPGAGNVWIECKALDAWPKRAASVVRFQRFTDEQRLFLLQRHGFLFVRVGREYLLFGWKEAFESCGKMAQLSLRQVALKHWSGAVNWLEFLEVIVNETPNKE